MEGQKGPIWIRVEIRPAFRRALRLLPESVQERMRDTLSIAMGIMRESVAEKIRQSGLIRSGKMLRATRSSVSRSAGGNWTGRVRVRRFYGRFHNTGATTVLKKDVRFPVGEMVEIWQIGSRQLKRPKYQLLNARWVTMKAGETIRSPATYFFDRGVEAQEAKVLNMFQMALAMAIKQQFGR